MRTSEENIGSHLSYPAQADHETTAFKKLLVRLVEFKMYEHPLVPDFCGMPQGSTLLTFASRSSYHVRLRLEPSRFAR
jgi:hypothetical protein